MVANAKMLISAFRPWPHEEGASRVQYSSVNGVQAAMRRFSRELIENLSLAH